MTGPNRIEDLLAQAERRALVAVLRAKPEITLDKLQDCFGGRHGSTLRSITVAELRTAPTGLETPADGGPPIDHPLRVAAEGLEGDAFDRVVLRVVRQAAGRAVSASYLRARVGGPRWKLQNSLRRLVDAKLVARSGITSSTRYRAISLAD
ncbi:MAG: hypothetical protein KC431_30725 [Myxococcales bacterium]|nr:hypothetical protein [Myxococcales bacterium]